MPWLRMSSASTSTGSSVGPKSAVKNPFPGAESGWIKPAPSPDAGWAKPAPTPGPVAGIRRV